MFSKFDLWEVKANFVPRPELRPARRHAQICACDRFCPKLFLQTFIFSDLDFFKEICVFTKIVCHMGFVETLHQF
jgi:hypothetical protein